MEIIIQDAHSGKKMIKNLFKQQTRVHFNMAVNKGYEMAIHAKENTNFLNYSKSRGKDLLSYLKNFAVEYSIIKYIESGLLPYDYEIKYNKNHSARYFVLFDQERKLELCVNQVNSKNNIGRKAFYRNKRIQSFNSYIKFDDIQEPEIITEQPTYFELNHGYQTMKPQFVVIGIPGTDGKWIDKVEISKELTLVQDTNTIQTKTEEIDFDFNKLQEYIEKSEENV
ncbi:hypothetical protein [Lentibacillus sp. Marseille-P4043]|uniref:hypothetical protein n=1 Tax=Lentibacillus sp. Marseille-P4043 TaxID=2040293 RepID=UPI000D0B10FC|nr:hypothetical protein [Lentibacillus sp. Marseille-P4043]